MRLRRIGSPLLIAVTVAGCAHAPVPRRSDVLLQGRIRPPSCGSVEIGSVTAALDGRRSFELRLPVEEPGYFTFKCGSPMPLFLTPGDRLRIEVVEDGSVRFTGRGAEANDFVTELARLRRLHNPSLSRSYRELAALQEEAFVSSWDSAYAVLFDPLDRFLKAHQVPKLLAAVERARILYPWAEGRARYPFLRWLSMGADFMEVGSRYDEYLSRVDLNDPRLLSLEEYTSFLGTYVHERARRALREDPLLGDGDNRWTRAEYAAAVGLFTDERVRNHVLHTILMGHVDRYGSKGLDALVERFEKDCTDERLVAQVRDAYQKDRGYWEGHETEAYKTVDGIRLDAHVFHPEDRRPGDRRPVLVWFHGGSWSEGAWYWCLGLCGHFVSQGMVVVQVEYRIQDRHGSTPLEAIADAKSAMRWVRTHADRLGVDPDRVVAAGFSAGGHLAASTAILQGPEEPGEDRSIPAQPNAVALFGACVDPTLDPWYRRVVRDRAAPEDGSPAHHVRPGLPPMISIHGTADRMCPFPSLQSFAREMKEAGNTFEVEAFEGRPHFFLWQNREDRTEALRRTTGFLASLGFVAKEN